MSKESSAAMINRLQGGVGAPGEPNDITARQEAEANIKVSRNWITAINSGTFPGYASLHVATLLDFLTKQNEIHTKAYEEMFAAHPEWAKKPEAAK